MPVCIASWTRRRARDESPKLITISSQARAAP
jgi:hypothetical protein